MQKFISWLRHCAICQASFPPIPWLCSDCLKKLQSYYLPLPYTVRLQSHFQHCRLIDWTSENDYFIQRLIQSLKGEKGSPFFSVLARELWIRIYQLQSVYTENSYILIPCPARPKFHFLEHLLGWNNSTEIKQDHSFYWSQALNRQTGFPIYSALTANPKQTAQKRKSLLERKTRHFTLDKNISLPKNKTFVFTDDIVTSGATANAVYHALGRPKTFMIWSIFWRKSEFK